MKTVREVAKLTGVSVRTLHYYDEIGLLRPAEVTGAGYRLYGDDELARLQQILFFRELDFPLREIRAILDAPAFDPREALHSHRALLELRRKRLDGLIRLVDQTLKGESTMHFKEFDRREIDAARKQYAAEAKERWGKTDTYSESEKRASGYKKEDWARIQDEQASILRRLAACMDGGPGFPAAQAIVGEWQAHITRWFYPCTDEILAGLGELYLSDPRFQENLDRYATGLARFLSDAIRARGKA